MDLLAADLLLHLNELKGMLVLSGFADAGAGKILLGLGNEAVNRGRRVQGIFHAPPSTAKFPVSYPDVRCGGSVAAQMTGLKRGQFDVLVLEQIVDRESALWAFQFARHALVLTAIWAGTETEARKQLVDLEIAPGQLAHDLLAIHQLAAPPAKPK